MKKFISGILFLSFIALFTQTAHAVELVRQKNAATYVVFPIVKNDGTLITSAAGLDSEIDAFADGTAPDGFTDCTNEATEIGSTGQYYLSLSQSEMNNDYIILQVKSTTTDAMVQTLLIRTQVGDPLLLATTDDGGTINVTSGKIDEVATLTGHTAQTGDAYARLGAPAGASVSADIAAVKGDTAAILVDTAAMDTSGELRTLLYGSDTAGATAANQTTIIGYIDTEVAAILEDTGTTIPGQISGLNNISAGDVWDVTLSSHLTAGSTGNALNAAGSAGDPWSTALPGAYGAGSAGYIVGNNLNAPVGTVDTVVDAIKAKTDNLPSDPADASVIAGLIATVQADLDNPAQYKATGFSTHSAADVWAVATRQLTGTQSFNLTGNITGNLSGSVGSVSGAVGSVTGAVGSVTAGVTVTTNNDKTGYALSAAGIDAIWDEVQSGHSTAGSFGLYLDGKVSEAGGGGLTAADIADAVWDESLSGHSDSGSTGEGLSNASAAGDPWAVDLPGSYTGSNAGAMLSGIKDSTDGDKESGVYTGIENTIRQAR